MDRTCSIVAALAVVASAGCSSVSRPPSGEAAPALVLVQRGTGIVGVETPRGSVAFEAAAGLLSPDRRRLIEARRDGAETVVRELDPTSGFERWSLRVRGRLVPRAVSRSGIVALQTSSGAAELVIAARDGERRRLALNHTVEPEAFTADERTLVVVDYLSERGPDRYRLQELDLPTGRLSRLGARVKRLAPEEMRGTGRTARWAPDGSRLYTLFTRQLAPGHDHASAGHVTAFVHVLDARGWAHCVDLPAGFGATDGGAALAVAPDGTRAYAVDADAGMIAVIDTRALRVARVGKIVPLSGGAVSAAASSATLAVSRRTAVRLFDTGTMSLLAKIAAPADVTGLAASGDGTFYGVAGDRIVAVSRDRATLRTGPPVPGAGSIALIAS